MWTYDAYKLALKCKDCLAYIGHKKIIEVNKLSTFITIV